MKKILVTGGNGQLGSELKVIAETTDSCKFTFIDIADLDLTDIDAVTVYFTKYKFDYIVNCAAYTAVDKAEEEPELASRLNAELPGILARAAKAQGATILHISTDFVFEGDQPTPLLEEDKAKPVSVYGKTKLAGEKAIAQECQEHFIIRTSWLYSSFGNNFVKTILRLAEVKEKLGIVYDQVGTPTYARDLAEVIIKIIYTESTSYGLYHYSNEGVASWYDFALAICDLFELRTEVSPILAIEYPLPAKRPSFSVMNKYRIKQTFDLTIAHWRVSLIACKNDMIAN